MKQFFSGLMILSALAMTMPAAHAAGGATMTLSTDASTIERGGGFDIIVQVNPNGEELDTARAILSFTPGVLSVEDAELIGSFDRQSPGNAINNSNGQVSLGGFTLGGPVTRSGDYARVSFRAQQTGTATIRISPDSKLITAGEEKIDPAFESAVQVTVLDATADPTVANLSVSSSSHVSSAIWYNQNEVSLSWEVDRPGTSNLTGFYVAFDQQSDTDPTQFVNVATTSQTYSDVEDGVWYFHLKGQHADGKETSIIHRRVAVDTTPPNELAVEFSMNQILEGETTDVFFGTTDDHSGVLYYEAAINKGAFEPHESPLTLGDMEPGTYFVEIKAVDRAGNQIFGSNSMRVYPEGTELNRPDAPKTDRMPLDPKMLISIVLGALILSGIIYGIKKKRQ